MLPLPLEGLDSEAYSNIGHVDSCFDDRVHGGTEAR